MLGEENNPDEGEDYAPRMNRFQETARIRELRATKMMVQKVCRSGFHIALVVFYEFC
jgi:hypothetical protein